MRNHELERDTARGAFPQGQPKEAYHRDAHGGVSRLVIDPNTYRVTSSNMVLTGTLRNCAGGPSPWGWLSCEESLKPDHGYVFACGTDAVSIQPPKRIPAYGRFRHEAVAINPQTFAAYLTEDDPDGCLYRMVPPDHDQPFEGRLEALRIVDHAKFHTGTGLSRPVDVEWVALSDVSAQHKPLRDQADELGAAKFRRGEGIWWVGDGVAFTATAGGSERLGQIFHLSTDDRLTLIVESQEQEQMAGPDNITLAPWGDLIVAEDTAGATHLRGVTRNGDIYPIARNMLSNSEFAGVCFSPDGTVLFANLQHDGVTIAITGPWETLRAGAPT